MNELLLLLKELGVDEEKAGQIVESATGLVSAETEKGKEFYRKKDGEAKGLRESLKKLGFDSDKFSSVDEYLSSREKETNQKDTTMESLKEALEDIKGKLAGETELRLKGERDTLSSKAVAELTDGLSDVYGSKHVIRGILADHNVSLSESGGIMLGDKGVADFMASFRESNPDIIRANQDSGTGVRQDPSAAAPTDWQNMTLAEASKQ